MTELKIAPIKCNECGRGCVNGRALAQHRVKKHGYRGKQAVIRERATAVVGWWDGIDTMNPGDDEQVRLVTREMNKRIHALREALDL